jgi:hypothetical protein
MHNLFVRISDPRAREALLSLFLDGGRLALVLDTV